MSATKVSATGNKVSMWSALKDSAKKYNNDYTYSEWEKLPSEMMATIDKVSIVKSPSNKDYLLAKIFFEDGSTKLISLDWDTHDQVELGDELRLRSLRLRTKTDSKNTSYFELSGQVKG